MPILLITVYGVMKVEALSVLFISVFQHLPSVWQTAGSQQMFNQTEIDF